MVADCCQCAECTCSSGSSLFVIIPLVFVSLMWFGLGVITFYNMIKD